MKKNKAPILLIMLCATCPYLSYLGRQTEGSMRVVVHVAQCRLLLLMEIEHEIRWFPGKCELAAFEIHPDCPLEDVP